MTVMKAKKNLIRLIASAVILLTSLFAHAEEEEKPEKGPIPEIDLSDIPDWIWWVLPEKLQQVKKDLEELPVDLNAFVLDTNWFQWVFGRTILSAIVCIWGPLCIFFILRLLLRKMGWWGKWELVVMGLCLLIVYPVCRFSMIELEFFQFTGDRYLHLYTPRIYNHGGAMTAAYFLPLVALLLEWRWIKDLPEAHLRHGLLNHFFGDGELVPEEADDEKADDEAGSAQADAPKQAEQSAPSPAVSPAVTPQAVQPEPQQPTARGGRRRSRRIFSTAPLTRRRSRRTFSY